jgi:hypothetical protein
MPKAQRVGDHEPRVYQEPGVGIAVVTLRSCALDRLDQDRLTFDFGGVGLDWGARGTRDALAVGPKFGTVAGADQGFVCRVPLQGATPVATGCFDRGDGFALGDYDHRLGSGDRRGGDFNHAVFSQGCHGTDDRESIFASRDRGACGGFCTGFGAGLGCGG